MNARATALFLFLTAGAAAAQDGSIVPLWMTPEAEIGAMAAVRPAGLVANTGQPANWRLGELAFRSPETLGGEARRAGLSCNSCHPAGGANTAFFIPGLSGMPGTVDVTHKAWNPAAEDGVFNPVRIPALWNAGRTAPYGSRGAFPALDDFIGNVIRHEFAGEVSPSILGALGVYVAALPPPANAQLREDGRLAENAPLDAHRGRESFAKGCAGCHSPGSDFQDGKLHDGRNTPSLLGLSAMTSFFHDGSSGSLAEAIESHARRHGISHGTQTRSWVLAYVQAVGAIDPPRNVALTIDEDIERIALGVDDLLAPSSNLPRESAGMAARMLRREVGLIHARLPLDQHAGARAALERWADALRAIGMAVEGEDAASAAPLILDLRLEIADTRAAVRHAGPTSLYQAERLAAWKRRR